MARSNRFERWRNAALLVATGAFLLIAASAAHAVEPFPYTEPAQPLFGSSETVALDASTTPHAVFELPGAHANEWIRASIDASSAVDFRVALYELVGPTAQLVAAAEDGEYPRSVETTSQFGGLYLLHVFAYSGSGPCTITVESRRASRSFLYSRAPVFTWGTSAWLTARVTEYDLFPIPLARVTVQRSLDASSWADWRTFATNIDGKVLFSATPRRKTYFRTVYAGSQPYFPSVSKPLLVSPRLALGTPVVPTTLMREDVRYRVYGALKPHQSEGASTVRIKAYRREGGKWVFKRSFSTRASDYRYFSRYRGSIVLDRPGRWRIHASSRADDTYARSAGGFVYVTVR